MKHILTSLAVFFAAGAFAAVTAHAQLPEKKFLTKDFTRPEGSLFAPGVMIGKTVYISGKGDYKPDEPIEGKVRNCLNEIKKSLEVGGMDYRNIAACWCYLEDPEVYPEFNKIYAEFFPENPPARTTLGVPNVPGDSRIEITAIAYTDTKEMKRIGDPIEGFPFSHGIQAGTTLYISGKGDQLPGGGHPATFEEQVRQAMKNVEKVLTDAGLSFKNVVFSNVYLDNYDNYGLSLIHI